MSNEESILIKLRNQVLMISIASCLSLLGANFLFMFTINGRMNDTNTRINKIEDRFNIHIISREK